MCLAFSSVNALDTSSTTSDTVLSERRKKSTHREATVGVVEINVG